ncbi:MAG TPA: M17 family peptidase N-terminal domain-containing protein, partial [Alphaproteobacteria bacterium]|nr:M17 family peptidase N-terminal domain-containing protein [Alphaproteobacteria bacterium]
MDIEFGELATPKKGAVVVGVLEGGVLSPSASVLDKATSGALARAIAHGRFKGKRDQLAELVAPSGVALSRIVMVGIGKPGEVDELRAQAIGGRAAAHLAATGEKEASVLVDSVKGPKLDTAHIAANIGYGARLRSYRFDKYLTKEKPEDKPSLMTFRVLSSSAVKA